MKNGNTYAKNSDLETESSFVLDFERDLVGEKKRGRLNSNFRFHVSAPDKSFRVLSPG